MFSFIWIKILSSFSSFSYVLEICYQVLYLKCIHLQQFQYFIHTPVFLIQEDAFSDPPTFEGVPTSLESQVLSTLPKNKRFNNAWEFV